MQQQTTTNNNKQQQQQQQQWQTMTTNDKQQQTTTKDIKQRKTNNTHTRLLPIRTYPMLLNRQLLSASTTRRTTEPSSPTIAGALPELIIVLVERACMCACMCAVVRWNVCLLQTVEMCTTTKWRTFSIGACTLKFCTRCCTCACACVRVRVRVRVRV